MLPSQVCMQVRQEVLVASEVVKEANHAPADVHLQVRSGASSSSLHLRKKSPHSYFLQLGSRHFMDSCARESFSAAESKTVQ